MTTDSSASGAALFPSAFVWGAATSAYQIEGSPLADGAGPSNWHRFTHTPSHISDGSTGDRACDHYRLWREDLDLMQSLGLKAYRFSIAWGRIFPDGTGAVNARGLDWYERLVDGLLARGIEPFPTLYHWDLPAALQDRGGWLHPDSAGWFAGYAEAVVQRLGDRVSRWTTLNEPWVAMHDGFVTGNHAPGRRCAYSAPRVALGLLRAHARGFEAAKASGAKQVGIAVNLTPHVAATDRPEDLAAAERAGDYVNKLFLDPLYGHGIPDSVRELFEGWPEDENLDGVAKARPDFVGVNYYLRETVRDAPEAWPTRAEHVDRPQSTYSAMGWEVHAPSFADTLRWVAERYGNPEVYITENGAAFYDPPRAPENGVKDPLRTAYYRDHLGAVTDALASGADVRGYFAWSLFDNFEWAFGYAKRFGIVHVDYATMERTPKDSARFYREVIQTNGANLGARP